MSNQLLLGFFILISIFAWGEKVEDPLYLAKQDADKMGKQIWRNECGGQVEGLTTWNQGEEFASLGIGHFIWYPGNAEGPFRQTFPDLLLFFKQEGVKLPAWLEEAKGCVWQSREEFYQALQSIQMIELRQLLAEHIDLQIVFMVNRLQNALPNLLRHLPNDKKKHIALQFYRLASSSQGLYALLDYINFKGEGISGRECYEGEGWGLLQVLDQMQESSNEPIEEFIRAAKQVLEKRVQNSPVERNEQRWLKGWYNRLETYRHFII